MNIAQSVRSPVYTRPVRSVLQVDRGVNVNLLAPGTFDSGTEGWDKRPATDGTVAAVSGELRMTPNPAGGLSTAAGKAITVVSGVTYRCTADIRVVSGGGVATFGLFTSSGGGGSLLASASTASGTFVGVSFDWLADRTSITPSIRTTTIGATVAIDNVTMRAIG